MLTLFTKTYVKDYEWLKLAIKSVARLCTEPIDWVFVGDNGSRAELEALVTEQAMQTKQLFRWRIVEMPELWPECNGMHGYLSQQWVKMTSHKAMPEGLYWNWDSDVIATKPISSQSFLGKSGKPIYWISQFNSIMNGADRPAHEGRMTLLREIFGLNSIPANYMRAELPFEYMRTMPIPLYGNLLKICSERVEWQRSLQVLQSGDHRFSEFNVIGNVFHIMFPEAFEWHNCEAENGSWGGGYVEGGVGSGVFQEHAIICQNWSWGPIPNHIREFVDKL